MELTGFRNYNWKPDGYYFAIDPKNTFVPSVEPQILLRPGTWATFGLSQVGSMTIIGGFGIIPGGVADLAGPEAAFQNLFKRLDIANPMPGQIRANRNDGVAVTIQGVLAIPNFASRDTVNFKDASFVCAQPFFIQAGWTSGGGFV